MTTHGTGRRPVTAIAMGEHVAERLITPVIRRRLNALASVRPGHTVTEFDTVDLSDVEVLFTCWHCPPITAQVLDRAPRLRAVIHAAGTVKDHITDACWQRGITVTSAAAANAEPVAEFTLAAILFAGKRVVDIARTYQATRRDHAWDTRYPDLGNYQRTIGIVGASRIGRRVVELLEPFSFNVLVYDPYLAGDLPGARTSDLDELVASSHIVSLHAPDLPETRHMIDATRLAAMRDGATLINTARAALVDQKALTAELLTGRLHAVLDHTAPEVLPPDSPLYGLPNAVVTPHIAGSIGNELARMAHLALDELDRYAHGIPLQHRVDPHALLRTA
ncbi:2-hydroxyacid family dehydrogenase [Streptomyces bingchenggensis BCW-1]|uniref:2-hydroxyacid family dehydrogenase n=1 Tax=Streptomyces bingchenggensis (strain BCW-1) TaxID=749414 RepID=D7BUF9_STRBB|nr:MULTISPECIES: hydroxyacid dehydrogenase [Streptomyces]ADI11708.1 2-hydroxyacid family dehydrogenase [Streptomyces bingchenggensis BCW-1]